VEISNTCTIVNLTNLYSTDYSQFSIMTVYQNSILEQSLHTYERQRHTNSMTI